MSKRICLYAAIAAILAACSAQGPAEVGKKTDALAPAAWEASAWISAADAPVANATGYLAADGASWFVSPVRNEKKVVSATWMTTGLGVYQLFLNGVPVG